MENKPKNWRAYQQEVAEVFKALGLEATVEASVEGARGTHDVDVWVVFNKYGFETKWLVECKLWTTAAVPKEKVLALHQIAQDVGADRAFLLSESGFQSGAIQVAKHTNITLISLDYLKASTSEELFDAVLSSAAKKLSKLRKRVMDYMVGKNGETFPFPGLDKSKVISLSATLFQIRMDFSTAIVRDFPIYMHGINDEPLTSHNMVSFAQNLKDVLNQADEEVIEIDESINEGIRTCLANREELAECVNRLVKNAAETLFCQAIDGSPEFERLRMISLQDMKDVGQAMDDLRTVASGRIKNELYALRGLLIDSVYLHLTQTRVDHNTWKNTEESVKEQIKRLRAADPVTFSADF